MSAFAAAVNAEFAKVLTTRMWWILALILFGYVGLCAGGLAALFSALGDQMNSRPGAPHIGTLAPSIYSFVTSVGYVFPVLFGALATTGEFRHQTLTPTFLATPHRQRVLGAKNLSFLVIGAVYGVIGLLASVGIGAIVLAAFDKQTLLGETDTWALVGRAILAMALWATLGVGLGALVRNQVAAIVGVLVFTQFIEPLLRAASSLADWIGQVCQFLPGAASDALVGSSFFTSFSLNTVELDWWAGGLVLLAYAALFTVVGYFVSWRKDVT